MKTFWLYELNGHGGIFQGCTGPDAERIVKLLAADPPEDGGSPSGAFPVYDTPAAWVKTSERRPDAGRLIVKRWKNGSVWAGVYSGSEKDSSFDEWTYLP